MLSESMVATRQIAKGLCSSRSGILEIAKASGREARLMDFARRDLFTTRRIAWIDRRDLVGFVAALEGRVLLRSELGGTGREHGSGCRRSCH
jgi:hypothetical protein